MYRNQPRGAEEYLLSVINSLVDMSSESVGLLSSPDRSSSPSLTDRLVSDCCSTTQIPADFATGVLLSHPPPRSPGKRQLTIEDSLITTNDSKRLCNRSVNGDGKCLKREMTGFLSFSNLREQPDLHSISSTVISSSPASILDSSPPTPPLSADVVNWLSFFLAMSSDDRSRATEALIRTCSTNTLQLNHIKNQIEPYFQRDFIRDLPRELALHVLRYLPASDVARASRTCRAWYDTCNDLLLWKRLCRTQMIPLKQLPSIFDETIDNQWKRSFACHKHLEYVWQHGQPLPDPLFLRGHEDFVITCLQFDGKRIVSGSDDNTLKIWSVATGQVRGDSLEGNKPHMYDRSFLPLFSVNKH